MKTLLFIAGVVALFALPFVVTSSYYLPLITTIVIYSILVLGLDIVFGYTGEVSIGHAALFGVGAYTAGLLSHAFRPGLLVGAAGRHRDHGAVWRACSLCRR
jgi:ABC-type branched-subunit amino acid transport system permease subunit